MVACYTLYTPTTTTGQPSEREGVVLATQSEPKTLVGPRKQEAVIKFGQDGYGHGAGSKPLEMLFQDSYFTTGDLDHKTPGESW